MRWRPRLQKRGTYVFVRSASNAAAEEPTPVTTHKLVAYLGYCASEDTRLWKATQVVRGGTDSPDSSRPEDTEAKLPTYVLTEAEVLRGRGGQLDGPHVGQPVSVELPGSGVYHAVVTAYYPPTDAQDSLWSIRHDEDDDMEDYSVRRAMNSNYHLHVQ